MLEISLLGEQYVLGATGGPAAMSSRSIALLAYLALHADAPQSRTRIAGLFWPDSSEAQARTNLRRELHHLRRVLDHEPSLEADGPSLTWHDRPDCRVDLREFTRERAAAEAAADTDEFAAHAGRAVAAYGGDLLPGLYDDWVLEARDALRRQCVQLLDRLVTTLRERGDVPAAVELARRRLATEPLEESGYRTLMELHAEMGDRAGAISVYHQCAATLERELGVDPSPQTMRLLDVLLGSPGATAAADGGSGRQRRRRPPEAARPAFVGRADELTLVEERWGRALLGQPGLVVLAGEAGVGKSRLAAEVAARAEAGGALVGSTRCFGSSRRLALAPVADWLREPAFARAVRSLDPMWRAEVGRLLPQLAADEPAEGARPGEVTGRRPGRAVMLTQSPAARAMVDAWRRHSFYEGLARAVLAPSRPTLLVLDDLQWCDEDTAAWLTFLLRLADTAPLLLVTTARPDELDANAEVARVVRALEADGTATRVQVGPLRDDEVRELAGSLLGSPLSDTRAQLLASTTGGYPLYVVETIRGAADAGDDDASIATDLAAVLRHRLESVSDEARQLAGLAAASGRGFGLDLLTEASDLGTDAVVRAVDELWRQRIVVESEGAYDFSHDLLRDVAYEMVTPARRWLLHRRLAQSLELLNPGHEDDVAAALAEQYDKGGQPDRARRYYRLAAEQAAELFAHREAVRLFQRALELTRKLPASRMRDDAELDLLAAMSAPTTALHGYQSRQLQETLERCVALADKLGRTADLMAARTGLFAVRFVQGRVREAHAFALSALELADVHPDVAGQAYLAVAGCETSLGRLLDATQHFERARQLSRGSMSLIVGSLPEVHGLAWHTHCRWLLGDDTGAVEAATEAVALAEREEHPYSLAVALGYQATTNQLRGDLEQAGRSAARLVELCDRYAFAWYGEWGHIVQGWIAGGETGIHRITDAMNRLRSRGALARMPYWLCLLADLYADLDEPARAGALLDAARATAEQNDELWWLPETMRRQAALLPTDAAAVLLDQAANLAQQQHSVAILTRCLRDQARLESSPR